MPLLTGLLTFILVLDSLLLILLILIQLPKKEAGMGTAFGGGATDALFGAGTGNVLTKATKYCATIFLVLALTLSILGSGKAKAKSGVQKELLNPSSKAPTTEPVTPSMKATPPPVQPQSASVPVVTNLTQVTNTAVKTPTNAPAVTPAAATNAPAKTAPPAK